MTALDSLFDDLDQARIDVANLLSRQMLLAALPRKALELTGADMAFVAERKDEALQIRYLCGNETDSLANLPVPLGRGLGGLVASQRRPLAVRDYYGSEQITHDFDTRVRAERLRSIAAAPIVVGAEVEGVVYVAMRNPTSVGDGVTADLIRLSETAASGLAFGVAVRDMMETAVHDDRRQLAIRLHDSVGQMLFGIGAAARDLRVATQDDQQLQQRVALLEQQVREVAAGLREAMNAWSAPPRERELAVCLSEDIHAFEERTGVSAQFLIFGQTPPLEESRACALTMVCREALLNVEKHAHACAVIVTLYAVENGVGLAVVDDGRGFRLRDPAGIGLRSCRARLERIGGSLTVSANEDGPGTTVRAALPC